MHLHMKYGFTLAKLTRFLYKKYEYIYIDEILQNCNISSSKSKGNSSRYIKNYVDMTIEKNIYFYNQGYIILIIQDTVRHFFVDI